MKCSIRFVALVVGLVAALSASAQIYQWKDKDGKTHFSDMPPPNQPGVRVQTLERASPPATVAEPEPDETETEGEGGAEPGATPAPASVQEKSQTGQRDEEFRKRRAAAAEAREKAEKDAADTAQRRQDCLRARGQYAALNSGQRIFLPTEGGDRRVLSDGERAAEIARTEELIEAFCGKD